MKLSCIFLKRPRVFFSFLVSYVVIFLVPLTISVFSYFNTLGIVEQDTREANLNMLKQVSDTIDKRLTEIYNLSFHLSYNTKIKDLASLRDPLESNDYYKIWDAVRDLSALKTTNNLVIDFFIYFKNNDLIIGPNLKYNSYSFYNSFFHYADIDYAQWKDKMLEPALRKKFFPATDIVYEGVRRTAITNIESIWNDLGKTFVLIDEEQVKNHLSRIDVTTEGFLYIIDADDNVITRLAPESDSSYRDILFPLGNLKESGYMDGKVEGKDMIISHYTSSQTKWRYFAGVPRAHLLAKVRHLQFILAVVLGMCLMSGIALAYVFANRNSRPVQDVISVLKQRSSAVPSGGNEYDIIKSTISRLIEDEEKLKSSFAQQIPMMRSNLLIQLMKGDFENQDSVSDFGSFIKVDLQANYYISIILRIVDYPNTKEGNGGIYLFKTVILNAVQLMLDTRTEKGFAVQLSKAEIGIVLCLKDCSSNPEWYGQLKSHIEDMRDILIKDYQLTLLISIGGVYQDVINIKKSYDEAVKAMNYIALHEKNNVISYSDIHFCEEYYYYPVENEFWLLEHTKLGDYEGISAKLKENHYANFVCSCLKPDMAEYLIYSLKATVIKALNELKATGIINDADENEILEILKKQSDVTAFYQDIDSIYYKLCNTIASKKISFSERLRKDIIGYIRLNYHEKELSLSSLADHLKYSESYLSRFFVKNIGKAFPELVNQIRIEKAKEKLQSGKKLSNAAVAAEVGYFTERSFYRAFKEIVGMTPNEYRQAVKSNAYECAPNYNPTGR